ncbi:hypothetical protein [Bryobacter aggregatus]|uniref:hypothetical protein n=1 Tax=Bryobacter aggregatus TaxID=360054 RepID=UPI0004E22CF8|nr:hypothetical protein [Bryobacter aggregatus]
MTFPTLISGQLVQSSTVRSQPIQHWEHLFAGLGRQTQRWTNSDRRSWRLSYRALNGDEAMRLRAFYESIPLQGLFHFQDPWTGTDYPHCRIRDGRMVMSCDAHGRYTVDLEIENAD